MDYGYGYGYEYGNQMAEFFATFGIFIILIGVLCIVALIAKYKIFKKMGIDGWKALVPYVDNYFQMEATGIDARWLLIITFGGVVSVVPVIGYLLFVITLIYYCVLLNVSLARAFGKGSGFAVGLVLLNPIFLIILGFGNSQYIGKKPMHDFIFDNINKDKNTQNTNPVNNQQTPTDANPSQGAAKHCTNCGAELENGAEFCKSCGSKVN